LEQVDPIGCEVRKVLMREITLPRDQKRKKGDDYLFGQFRRFHCVHEEEFDRAIVPLGNTEILVMHDDLVSPGQGSFQELGQEIVIDQIRRR